MLLGVYCPEMSYEKIYGFVIYINLSHKYVANSVTVFDDYLTQIFHSPSQLLGLYIFLMELYGYGKIFVKHLFSCHQKHIINSYANRYCGIIYLLMKLHVFWVYDLGYIGLQWIVAQLVRLRIE